MKQEKLSKNKKWSGEKRPLTCLNVARTEKIHQHHSKRDYNQYLTRERTPPKIPQIFHDILPFIRVDSTGQLVRRKRISIPFWHTHIPYFWANFPQFTDRSIPTAVPSCNTEPTAYVTVQNRVHRVKEIPSYWFSMPWAPLSVGERGKKRGTWLAFSLPSLSYPRLTYNKQKNPGRCTRSCVALEKEKLHLLQPSQFFVVVFREGLL